MNFMSSEFVTWMDRRALDEELADQADEDDAAAQILQRKGLEHEARYLQTLQDSGLSVCVIEGFSSEAQRATEKAMRDGIDVIYQAKLEHEQFGGIADFLIKVDGESNLGNWHYEVWDTKLARELKPDFIVQLCCYAELLVPIQGRLPEQAGIILGTGEKRAVSVTDFFFYYQQLKASFLSHMQQFDPAREPQEIVLPSFSKWTAEAERLLDSRDDLSLVANIRRNQIKLLKGENVSTLKQLAESEFVIRGMRTETLDNLRRQAKLQVKSRENCEPVFEVLPPSEGRKGLKLLPPAHDLDVWFDMEGYTLSDPPLEYLFGVTHLSNSNPDFKCWWAHTFDEERAAFEDFIDWIVARWESSQRRMHVFHYAPYEVTAVKRLMQKYGTRESQVDDLLRNEVFVDLYKIVRHAICIGEPSYSIKFVEHLYRGKRQDSVANAVDSIVFYDRWLESGEPQILQQILDYNKVDCDSTMQLTEWLRGVQDNCGIEYEPRPPKEEKPDKPSKAPARGGTRDDCAALAAEMLQNRHSIADPEKKRIHELLAYLLEFHAREDKCVWWKLFEKQGATQDELHEDAECLGGLEFVEVIPKTGRQQKPRFKYRYDPSQDSSIATTESWALSHDINCSAVIKEFDEEQGTIVLTLSVDEPPAVLGLIPKDIVPADVLRESIYAVVSQWHRQGTISDALYSLIHRDRPRVANVQPGQSLLDAAIPAKDQLGALALAMQNSAMCVQGPPGTGKTFSASIMISELVAAGKKIAIASNSHSAIENLLRAINKAAVAAGQTFVGYKVGDGFEEGFFKKCESGKLADIIEDNKFQVVGGTAWAFARAEVAGQFDYLIVDEAGQVCLANLVAMSPCARNIILLGDQMQLEQPVQGSHPGESGLSCLEYYIQNQPTVPPDRGVFLGTTFRLHPDLCKVISEQVYENRLTSAAGTDERILRVPADSTLIRKNFGILYAPVDHIGNTLSSIEEAVHIRKLVDELLECESYDDENKKNPQWRRLSPEKILVVAPYNAQVRLLRQKLQTGVLVGTVDKFQGREAPVAILSMCSSDPSSSPRGVPFLFDKHRLNVALSRAQSLAIVVAAPPLVSTPCTSLKNMALLNFYCRIVSAGATP
jgi:predicted RecB family nuclease